MPPAKRAAKKATPPVSSVDPVEAAVAAAFEKWRNRPGRAAPRLVREALLDAARRAYDAKE